MSEVTVFIRQGDPNRASKKGQKRPLSIITENDSDDLDAINTTKLQDVTEGYGKENTSCCKDIPETNKSCQVGEIICKVSEIARNSRNPNSVSDYKTSLWLPVAGSKHPVLSASFTKLIKVPLAKLPPDPRIGVLENTPSNSVVILESDDSKCPDENFWKQQGVKSLNSVSQDVKTAEIPQCNQTSTTYKDTSVLFNGTQMNNLAPSNSIDPLGLGKIQQAPDRLHITLPLNTTVPSTPSPQLNGTFNYRTRQQTSPKNFHELKSPVSPNSPKLRSNTNEGSPILVSLTIASPDSDETTDKSSSDNSPSNNNLGSMFSKFASSKLSSYFSRRMSNESIGSLSESDLSDGDIGADDNPSAYLSYFRRLKETTDKLHLSTRRPSIMLWRQQCLESQNLPRVKHNLDSSDDCLTLDRKHRIDRALEWLRIQLQEMRSQDQQLARQLLSIRHDIHKLKLQRSTEEHQELIDDFHFELQEMQEFSDILDLPIPEYGSNPLKQIGITRLNISARRFSAC